MMTRIVSVIIGVAGFYFCSCYRRAKQQLLEELVCEKFKVAVFVNTSPTLVSITFTYISYMSRT